MKITFDGYTYRRSYGDRSTITFDGDAISVTGWAELHSEEPRGKTQLGDVRKIGGLYWDCTGIQRGGWLRKDYVTWELSACSGAEVKG